MSDADQLRYGSKRWKWDPRERGFSHSKFFGAADLSQLPREGLRRARRPVENQLTTLRCTAYAGAVANGYIHGLEFHPDWQAKKIGQKQRRNVDLSGAEPKAAMKSLMRTARCSSISGPSTSRRPVRTIRVSGPTTLTISTPMPATIARSHT